jgi:hypothetical protein
MCAHQRGEVEEVDVEVGAVREAVQRRQRALLIIALLQKHPAHAHKTQR